MMDYMNGSMRGSMHGGGIWIVVGVLLVVVIINQFQEKRNVLNLVHSQIRSSKG